MININTHEPHSVKADCKVPYNELLYVYAYDNVVFSKPSMQEEQSSSCGYPKMPWLGSVGMKFPITAWQNSPDVLLDLGSKPDLTLE